MSYKMGLFVVTLSIAAGVAGTRAQQRSSPPPGALQPNVLYGAAYYNEYMPAELQPGRLEKDVALMQAAGITVVRMGESTWSLWEPSDGAFETAWMDRVVEAMGRAGIKVILGTPTYSVPPWMARAHPEMLARPLGGAEVFYGRRQNMDTDDPSYRRYAERLIVRMVEHYRDNPTVIGWQIDNETASYGASNPALFQAFVSRLQNKFKTPEAMNQAWFLNYWGQDVFDWKDMPPRDSANSTSYKLEWSRFEQDRVTEFLAWQAALVRKHRSPRQFVTQDFGMMMHTDVNEADVARLLDVVSNNPYHGSQDHMDGAVQALQGDFARSLKKQNFFVTETNAQTTGWDSSSQYPPYDGQMRLDVYSDIACGANMVEYWHWASTHAGQETYWKGVLSHDLEPNRAYAEVSRIAGELKRIGPEIVNLKVDNQVAILYSVDSYNGLNFMPIQHGFSYTGLVSQLHQELFHLNVGVDFVFPEASDWSKYKLLVIPALYIADDVLLRRIDAYVHGGGHVLMTFKSAFANENSVVRWERAPGPLRKAAGFSYQEFSNLENPLALKGDPYGVGKENAVKAWAEFLQLETAKPLAFYDHPFFGQWPAITRNTYGRGSLTYEGTMLSDRLQQAMLADTLKDAGVPVDPEEGGSPVRIKSGINGQGKSIHYFLNYSSAAQRVTYKFGEAQDLLTHQTLGNSQELTVPAWGVVIAEEKAR